MLARLVGSRDGRSLWRSLPMGSPHGGSVRHAFRRCHGGRQRCDRRRYTLHIKSRLSTGASRGPKPIFASRSRRVCGSRRKAMPATVGRTSDAYADEFAGVQRSDDLPPKSSVVEVMVYLHMKIFADVNRNSAALRARLD